MDESKGQYMYMFFLYLNVSTQLKSTDLSKSLEIITSSADVLNQNQHKVLKTYELNRINTRLKRKLLINIFQKNDYQKHNKGRL